MTQSRFKSGALWLSLFFLTVMLLTSMGLGFTIPVGLDVVFTCGVGVLTFLGIVTNTKDGKWYWSPNTPWSVRLRSPAMWIGIIGLLMAMIVQILKWFNVWPLPFDLKACLMTFLAILQATGVIDGSPVVQLSPEDPQAPAYLPDEGAGGDQ